MNEVLDRVKALRDEMVAHERELSELYRQRLARLTLLCRRGIVPESEAMDLLEQHVEHAAAEGGRRFRNGIDGFLRPGHRARNEQSSAASPAGLSEILGYRFTYPGRGVGDSPETLCFLLKDRILEEGRILIREACREAKEAGRMVPDRETREREISALDDEIERLRADHEQVKRDVQSLREAQRSTKNVKGPRVTFPGDDEPDPGVQAVQAGQEAE